MKKETKNKKKIWENYNKLGELIPAYPSVKWKRLLYFSFGFLRCMRRGSPSYMKLFWNFNVHSYNNFIELVYWGMINDFETFILLPYRLLLLQTLMQYFQMISSTDTYSRKAYNAAVRDQWNNIFDSRSYFKKIKHLGIRPLKRCPFWKKTFLVWIKCHKQCPVRGDLSSTFPSDNTGALLSNKGPLLVK